MREYINLIQQLSEGTGIVGLSAGEIIKYDARFKKFIEYVQKRKPFTTVTGDEVIIDPREAKRFLDLRAQDMFRGNLKARQTDGEEIALSQLAKTKDFGGAAPAAGQAPSSAGKEALVVKPGQIGIVDQNYAAEDFYEVIAGNPTLSSTDYGQVIQQLAQYIVSGEYVMLPEEYKGAAKEKVRKAIVDYAGEYLGVLALLYNRTRFPRKAQFQQWLGGDINQISLNFPSKANNNLADSFATLTNSTTNHTLNISSKGTGGGAAPAISGLVIPDHVNSDPNYATVVELINICKNDSVLMSIFNLMDLIYSVSPDSIDKRYHPFLPFSQKEPNLPALCKQSNDSRKSANPIGMPKKYKSLWSNVTGGGTEGGKVLYGIRKQVDEAVNKKDAIPEFKDAILQILEMNFIQQYCDYKNGELTFATQWPAKLDGKISLENKASTTDPLSNGFSFKLGRTDDSVSSESGEEPVDGMENDLEPETDLATAAKDVAEPKSQKKKETSQRKKR
jgi:hypothetical protein